MLLTLIIVFFLGAWLGSRSAQSTILALRKERDALKAQLGQDGEDEATVSGNGQTSQATSSAAAAKIPATTLQNSPTELAHGHDPRLELTKTKPVDNAIILLYFGAFLFTAAIGLFLFFAGLSGLTRSMLVGALAIGFYAIGLYIYENSTRLKPAGLTFTGIGMVLLPFFGLALHNLAFNGMYGPGVWAAVSLVAVVMYAYALEVTKHAYVTYFLIGSVLSLFESGVAITELPTYYFGLAMTLCGIVLLWFAHRKGMIREVGEPLELSSTLLVPASLLLSFFFVPDHGWLQVSLAFLVGAAYYALAAYLQPRREQQVALYVVADVLAVLAVAMATFAITEEARFASLALLFAGAGHVVVLYFANKWSELLRHDLAFVTSCTTLAGALLVVDVAGLFTMALVAGLAIHVALYTVLKKVVYLGIAGVIWISLPIIIGAYWATTPFTGQEFCLFYGLLAVGAFVYRLYDGHQHDAKEVLKVIYAFGLSFAWFSALAAGAEFGAVISLVLAVIAFVLSYFERHPEIIVVAGVLLYGAVGLASSLTSADLYGLIAIGFMTVSVVLYMASDLLQHDLQAQYLRLTAIAGAFAGAFLAPVMSSSTLLNPLALVIAGGLSTLEAVRTVSQQGKELSGAVVLAALQWALWLQGIENIQVYTHMWAVLLAGYAAWRSILKDKQNEEAYTVAALVVLTVPLALQALGDSGEFYGWLLIAEQIGLVLFGMLVSRPDVIRWGLVVAVLAVLYQLRELTFVVLALIGLGLIGLAVYLLNKKDNQF